ncbi:TRMT2A [Branchiostoma lanceolatum]|uniref:tRNA (uracil(54)-C(5))-methyltransferase n=1 Tax=Branchiostoma lanceolatum TaxID=7740 RepID=A0A8J9VEG8_BRALA|nr:TRMT2A [Branchiostoma lanceolatum]
MTDTPTMERTELQSETVSNEGAIPEDLTSPQRNQEEEENTNKANVCDNPNSPNDVKSVGTCKEKEDTENDVTTNESASVSCHGDQVPEKEGGDGERSSAAGTSDDLDPYAYAKDGKYTTENFKIEVRNLPRYAGFSQFKKRMVNQGLTPHKVKIIQRDNIAFVAFRCEEDRQKALEVLNSHVWKGCSLSASKSNPAADPLVKKRKEREESGAGSSQKRARGNDEDDEDLPVKDRLLLAVTPLWNVPYEEQLKQKTESQKVVLGKLSRAIENVNPGLGSWVVQQRKQYDNMCCKLEDITPSPILNNYRNKNEFNVGISPEGKEKTIGFRLGRYRGGSCTVVNPYDCPNLPETAKDMVRIFQTYLEQSTRSGYDTEKHQGHWKQVTVRTTQGSEVMAMLQFNVQDLPEEEIDKEKHLLLDYFSTGPGKDCGITSLFFQAHKQRRPGDEEASYQLILGKEFIQEKLLGMTFRISPDAFFQVNTLAAEVLYCTVADWCDFTENSTVLDVCCGTGTIGLTLAKHVKKVIGVELCHQAVEDAKVNASVNGIQNAEFLCGKAEDILPDLVRRLHGTELVAVVDPPRAGLHTRVISVLRKCSNLTKLVYVSCNSQSAMPNFIDLCRPTSNKYKGAAFRPVRAVPVDLFPHTRHSELIIQFERTQAT